MCYIITGGFFFCKPRLRCGMVKPRESLYSSPLLHQLKYPKYVHAGSMSKQNIIPTMLVEIVRTLYWQCIEISRVRVHCRIRLRRRRRSRHHEIVTRVRDPPLSVYTIGSLIGSDQWFFFSPSMAAYVRRYEDSGEKARSEFWFLGPVGL